MPDQLASSHAGRPARKQSELAIVELHQIRYFLAVCESRNFTRAAERCYVTQPSLTRAIQNLELELGGQLFNRGRAGATLTLLGEAIHCELAQVQRHVSVARTTAEGWAKGSQGILRIGVSTAVGPKGVAQFLAAFQACHGGLTLIVSEGTVEDLLSSLDRSDIDAAIVGQLPVVPSSLTVREMYLERLFVLVPLCHSLARLDPVPLAKLVGERVLVGTQGELRGSILSALRAERIKLNITCYSSRDEWLIGMVADGAGVAIVSEGQSLPGSLAARPLAGPAQQRSICLVLAEKESPSTVLCNLSHFADKYLRDRSGPEVTPIAV